MVGMVLQGLGSAILARLAAKPLPPELQVYSLPVPLERVIGVAVRANTLQTPETRSRFWTCSGVQNFLWAHLTVAENKLPGGIGTNIAGS